MVGRGGGQKRAEKKLINVNTELVMLSTVIVVLWAFVQFGIWRKSGLPKKFFFSKKTF